MQPPPPKHNGLQRTLVSRRAFLKSGVALAGTIPFSRYLRGQSLPDASFQWPSYILRREVDELFLQLTAVGYRERSVVGVRQLEPTKGFEDPCLVFTFPPQHFAESAFGVQRIPTAVSNKDLSTIALFPSQPSKLVFRTRDRKQLKLEIRALLDWQKFDLVLPDLDHLGSTYDLDVKDDQKQPFTRIEMPWGIYLTPVGSYGKPHSVGIGLGGKRVSSFLWEHSPDPNVSGGWAELWSTALENSADETSANRFEILGVRGFERKSTTGTVSSGDLVVTYSDDENANLPDWLRCAGGRTGTAPLCNYDRIELAANLSRRFVYTGVAGGVNTGQIFYDSQKVSVNACFDKGRTLAVDQYRLSPRGGSLELDNKWKVFPGGCELKGWKHSAIDGRDDDVELLRQGFLFPCGAEAELVTRSERVFVKDEEGHFVAILVKQAFLQVPQPNAVEIEHAETPFPSLSITTKSTPPLDLPESGDPNDYAKLDFFLPTVDHLPFEFEFVGIDWAGDPHLSKMPMFFVSSKTRSTNGLIWEPGDPDDWKGNRKPSQLNPIPIKDEGLRVVDSAWNSQPYRFAQYGDSAVAVALPGSKGDTTQRIEWMEWTRGTNPKLVSGIAPRPFQPRVRTMKVRIQGMSQFSGEDKLSLATYRDTRFTKYPVLDPEPNTSPDIYTANLPSDPEDTSRPYLFLLETRDLRNVTDRPVPDDEQTTRQRIHSIYYGSQKPNQIPDSLFSSINNEIQFGKSASSEGTGGLSVPDTHVVTLTRRYGPIGDATFNQGRWEGYSKQQSRLATMSRLDYAAFRLAYRPQMDVKPFDQSLKQADIDGLQKSAATLMGFTPTPFTVDAARAHLAAAASPGGAGLSLGDLFGGDAQILPGLSFADIFKEILMRDTSRAKDVTDAAATPTKTDNAADPLQWKLHITGIDWLLQLIGNGPGQVSLKDLVSIAIAQGQSPETSIPVDFGVEASLEWSNEAFKPVKLAVVEFNPIDEHGRKTRVEINARAKASLGLAGLPENLSELKVEPGKAEISAHAELKDFVVVVFDAIEIEFESISFTLFPDGRKDFSPSIRDVRLKKGGPLEFVSQLSDILKKLGGDSGLDIDISIARVRISETLKYPTKDEPLFIGPAQVTNLALTFGVMVPLMGRDVLSTSFALSSREKPLTIFVPPWYGGKAHVLMEVTTRGVRLLEVSMEYGALIPIHWGIAKGEASLTAGVFFMVERTDDKKSGKIILKAFVKAAANLDVAGIIHFCGQISISLSWVEESDPSQIVGEASVSVSIKIGFVRFSYSFTATHVEQAQGTHSSSAAILGDSAPQHGGPFAAGLSYGLETSNDVAGARCEPTIPRGKSGKPDIGVQLLVFGAHDPRREAFERIVDGYLA